MPEDEPPRVVGAVTDGEGSEGVKTGGGFGRAGGAGGFGTGTGTGGVVTVGTGGVVTVGTETDGVVTAGRPGAIGTVTEGTASARLTGARIPNTGCRASAKRIIPNPKRAVRASDPPNLWPRRLATELPLISGDIYPILSYFEPDWLRRTAPIGRMRRRDLAQLSNCLSPKAGS